MKVEISSGGPKSHETSVTLELPATWAEFNDALQRARVKDPRRCKNEIVEIRKRWAYFATPLGQYHIDRDGNLLELNLLAQRLAMLTDEQEFGFEGLVKMEFSQRPGAILHSDRGSQFTSAAFRACLDKLRLRQSMGRVGSCYDNARMESFWATLKNELIYRMAAHRFPARQVRAAVFRYIFGYYNTRRVYTANPGALPPAALHRLQLPQTA